MTRPQTRAERRRIDAAHKRDPERRERRHIPQPYRRDRRPVTWEA